MKEEAISKLKKYNQEHLLDFYDKLTQEKKENPGGVLSNR